MTFEDRLETARQEKARADLEHAEAAARVRHRKIQEARVAAAIALTELREAIDSLRRRCAASERLLNSDNAPYSGVEAIRGAAPVPAHRWLRRTAPSSSSAFKGWRVFNATSGAERVISLLIPVEDESNVQLSFEVRGRHATMTLDAFAKLGLFTYETAVGENELVAHELPTGDGVSAFTQRLMTHLIQLPA